MKQENVFFNEILNEDNAASIIHNHKLEGVFYQYLGAPENSQFKAQFQRQWIHNVVLIQTLQELAPHLKTLSTPPIILKGIHLVHDIYTDTGSRFMSDIDLLIDKKDQVLVANILNQAGFEELVTKKFYGNYFKKNFCKKIGEVEVNLEIHSELFYHHNFLNLRSEKSPLDHFQQLSPEDLFIHLAGHLALQHNFLFLYWLTDLYLLYEKNEKKYDWNYIYEMAKKRKLAKSVDLVLFVLNKCFNIQHKQRIKLNFLYSFLISRKFLLNPSGHRVRYYILKHLTKDNFLDALLYDWHWFKNHKFNVPND